MLNIITNPICRTVILLRDFFSEARNEIALTNNCCMLMLCSKFKIPLGLLKNEFVLRTMFSQDVWFATEIRSVPSLPPTKVKTGKALELEKSNYTSGLSGEVSGLHTSCFPVENHFLSL